MSLPLDLELAHGPLRLRPWQPADAPALHLAVQESLETVGRWLPWCHAGYDLRQAQAWIRHCREGWMADEHFAFGVFERGSNALLGSVGLNQRNFAHRSAALGYWVRQSRQGDGIARQAARLAARFGFRTLGLARIEIVVLPDNHASRRTAEQAGARFEAIARHRIWTHEAARDAAVYALVPGDLAPQG
ncbi:GNAT family N-acetyltransferase [Frateuria sp. STR12]|uniref:GNAT family N-acetyltransferase n=1 Tax=Frateuria hangzhouensis TaxID=2995589 RepID=UPI002260C44B|nr:GNAT family N-acetyltransferase [Frateuria sp. STR12]MCX7512180.1 GNAT family N-acetyltransferase [Frateuria sp. STR12]